MILPIYLYGQPVLRKEAEELGEEWQQQPEKRQELRQLVADMFETLTQADGCGLAAPQIGRSIRLFVVDGSELGEDYPDCVNFKQAFINPEIVEESEEDASYSEGCLSLPGISETVVRPESIVIRYLDEDFNEHEETYSGFRARIIEHEYDHLDGNVFTDRISPIRRQFVKGKLSNIAKGKTSARYRVKR
ncbi:MAG: peptide deformylase [Paludibacteraceae bacterium]|nr:peptide deformylase [Paludibacteraceae bacterium]